MPSRRSFLLALLATAASVAGSVPAQAQAAEPQRLFALDAARGTMTPVEGAPGMHRLVLDHVKARALYFTDRPAREVGTTAVEPMMRRLFAGDSPAPNGAINATAPHRGSVLMGVEIRAWHYDKRDNELVLRVRRLHEGGRTIAHVRDDTRLPRAFRDVSLFIDDCCDAAATATVLNPGPLDASLSVNNGPLVDVPGAAAGSWQPGSATLSYSPGSPTPGVLGPGTNSMMVVFSGAPSPIPFEVTIPSGVPISTLQLYFFSGPSSFSWTLLSSGQLIASGVAPGAGA